MSSRAFYLAGVAVIGLMIPAAAHATASKGLSVVPPRPVAVPHPAPAPAIAAAPAKPAAPPPTDGKSYTDYRSLLASSGGGTATKTEYVVDQSHLASRIIGKKIDEGTIDDIVVNFDGSTDKLLVKDSKNKIIAIDYKAADAGKPNVALKSIDSAAVKAAQPYDKTSVKGVLDLSNVKGAPLKSPDGAVVATISDVVIDQGKADILIIGTSGLTGGKAVMNFNDANIVNRGANGTFVQLNQHQVDALKKGK